MSTASAKPTAAAEQPAGCVKRAVLAGSNYINDPDSRLHGCVHDVLLMRDVLIKRYKIEPENIQLLIDEGNDGSLKQPTFENITAALRSAMKASKPGDVLYFHFSGHGSYQKDTNSDESDRRDEFIVTSNFKPLVDDYLRTLLATLAEGVKFTFVCDACHSGSMLDQPSSDIQLTGKKELVKDVKATADQQKCPATALKPRQLSPAAYIKVLKAHFKSPAEFLASLSYLPHDKLPKPDAALTWEAAVQIAVKTLATEAKGRAGHKPSKPTIVVKDNYVVLISGCQDNQTSADAVLPDLDGTGADKAYGALTYCLVQTINKTSSAITNYEAAKGARDLLKANAFDQNPVLTCPKAIVANAFIVG